LNTPRLTLLTVLLALYLQGCVSVPNQTTAIDPQAPPVQPDIANAWQLTGKLGFKSPQKAGSVNLNWHQSGADYQLKLSGPLGTGSAQITGNKDQIKVTRGTEHYMGTPKSIALQWLGVPLPVDAIGWWARGLPSPSQGATTHKIFDSAGNPQSFDQAGWKLTFSNFSVVGQQPLPKKVSGQLGDLSFKLVISRWSLSDN
jgi:outer membrane lipoprotein LolB